MGRNGRGATLVILLLTIVVAAAITIYYLFYFSKPPEKQAVEAIDTFYTYEQDGAFSDSWAMFHPLMKEKFPKGHYLQDRAHVFMNHFGVTTFTYELSDAVEVKNWKMKKGAEPISTVYKATVTQVFKGKYGNFSIVQDVYTTNLDGKWMVLWDYMK